MSYISPEKEKRMVALLALSAAKVAAPAMPSPLPPAPAESAPKMESYSLYCSYLVPEKGESPAAYRARLKRIEAYHTTVHKQKVVINSVLDFVKYALRSRWASYRFNLFVEEYLYDKKMKISAKTWEENPFVMLYRQVEQAKQENKYSGKNSKNLFQSHMINARGRI